MGWFDALRASSTESESAGAKAGMSRRARLLLGGLAMGALVAGGAAGDAILRGSGESHAASVSTTAPAIAGAPISFADVAARVKPAVVSVQVRVLNAEALAPGLPPGFGQDGPFGDLFRRFGLPDQPAPQAPREGLAQGSGFFISPDGYIVTNNHVVHDARSVTVTLDDGHTVNARVVATDPRTDLAVIKTESGSDYPFVRFASAEPRIGDWVLAVGNPFGLGGTVTAGIVSAHGRDIGEGPYDDFLQIDAPVNQGNSGGPSFNMNGEVVGINTAIYSPSGGNVGIAFAIPAATAQPIVATLEHGREIVRGYLGVTLQTVDQDIAHSLGLRDREGALVAGVAANGPAAHAGLREGDVITRAAGDRIADTRDLARIVAAHRPGSHLRFDLLRAGRRLEVNATLAEMPTADGTGKGKPPSAQSSDASAALGLTVAPAEGGGVQVLAIDPGSAAASHGLQPGDVILEAGGRACTNAADLEQAAAAARRSGRDAVLLRVQSGGQAHFVGLPLSNHG